MCIRDSWKTEREAEGIEFYDHLSKVIDTENDLSVGDMVAFTNDYGDSQKLRPHKVQISLHNRLRCV